MLDAIQTVVYNIVRLPRVITKQILVVIEIRKSGVERFWCYQAWFSARGEVADLASSDRSGPRGRWLELFFLARQA